MKDMDYNSYLGFVLPPLNKGQAGGVASLDDSGKVPASQLPSYVDDVLEYDTYQDFPVSGETGKIYLDKQTGATYRWTGSNFFKITSGLTNLVNGSVPGSVRGVNTAEEDNNYTIGFAAFVEGNGTKASGAMGHAEGMSSNASGNQSHAEGVNTIASGPISHAEGESTTASGNGSHAEGQNTIASGNSSHTEGYYTTASGNQSHAEGGNTTASGLNSHAEGYYTTASEIDAHAEGQNTTASGAISHAEGKNTIANHASQHVFGEYNIADNSSAIATARGNYVEIVGNGTSSTRSNARTLDWSGNQSLAGSLTLGMGTNNEATITATQLKSIVEESDIESITYSNLIAKRNNHTLVPNKKYRLTDYECTTTQSESRAISHPFDIILTAYNESILLEKASACLRDGDTYYSSHSNSLELWEVHYCIDNDTNRFAWADNVNGKGVIYYLKDDKGNEAPYDFKQIQFKRYQVTQCSTLSNLVGTYVHANYNTGIIQAVDTNNPLWCYTFSLYTNNEMQDRSIYEMYNVKGFCYNNIINTYISNNIISLNNIVFLNNNPATGRSCQSNFFAHNCRNFSFNDNCNTNTFGDNNYDIIFLSGCYTNTFGNKNGHIIFDKDCSYITGKTQCVYIIVEEFNNQINFNNYCQYIIIQTGVGKNRALFYNILDNTQGTSSSYITIPHTFYGFDNNPITTYIGKNTNGELKIWQPANLI